MKNTIENAEKFVMEHTSFHPQIGLGFVISRLLKMYAEVVEPAQEKSDEDFLNQFAAYNKVYYDKEIDDISIQTFLICKDDQDFIKLAEGLKIKDKPIRKRRESNFERRLRMANEKRAENKQHNQ